MSPKKAEIDPNPGIAGIVSSCDTEVGIPGCDVIGVVAAVVSEGVFGEVTGLIPGVVTSEVSAVVSTEGGEVSAKGVGGRTTGALRSLNGGRVVILPGGGRRTSFTGRMTGTTVIGWDIGTRVGPVVAVGETEGNRTGVTVISWGASVVVGITGNGSSVVKLGVIGVTVDWIVRIVDIGIMVNFGEVVVIVV